MRRTFGQIRAYFSDAAAGTVSAEMSRRARAGIYVGRLGVRIIQQWARDRCPQQASALAFQTALSLIPILAIAFLLLRSLGSSAGDAEDRLLQYLARQVLPDLREAIAYLKSFSAKISIGAGSGAGLVITLVTCYSLFASVEKTFNDIWRVGTRRTLVGKFLTFYALVTLLPVLAAASLYWTGKLIGTSGLAQFFVSFGIQFTALTLTNKLLPNMQVQWRAALAGAAVSGVALEGLKLAFLLFAKSILLQSYEGVYGPMALVPMLLFWIYVSWLLVLLGAEVANAVQNLRVLEAEDRRHRGDEPMNALVAMQLLAVVAAHHERGGRGITREALATQFGLTTDVVGRIVDRLKSRELIAEVEGDKLGLIPARSSRAIAVHDVLAAFRSMDLETAKGTMSSALESLIRDLEDARRQRIQGLTIADLLPEPPSDPGRRTETRPVV